MRTVYILIIISQVVLSASGQWQLVDDFQQWHEGQIFDEAEDINWIEPNPTGSSEFVILADPYNPNNVGMYIDSGSPPENNTFVIKALPGGGIAPNTNGTLFIRYLTTRHYNYWFWGTADRSFVMSENPLQSEAFTFDDFNALCSPDEEVIFGYWEEDEYVYSNPAFKIEENSWYYLWMVVNNTFNENVSSGTYSIYAQGPNDAEPYLVQFGDDPVKSEAAFRRAPLDDGGNPQIISWTAFATNNILSQQLSGTTGLFLIDDLYYSDDINLTNPILFAGFPTNGTRDVDTGDWLGWLNITQAPYIWSYTLNGWFYMDEPVADEPGAWGYFFK